MKAKESTFKKTYIITKTENRELNTDERKETKESVLEDLIKKTEKDTRKDERMNASEFIL